MKSIPKIVLLLVIAIALLISSITSSNGQSLTQTIRGTVEDIDSHSPIIGANVIILDNDPLMGATTDVNGEFRIENVSVGRISLNISYIGYESKVLPNILVSSAKEIVLEIAIEESVMKMEEIVIESDVDKSQTLNDMVMVSGRAFTVEETKRYAGALNDPARMVSSYAGVNTDAEGSNFIVVRGNSPKGVQWRMEGIEIPNPNHFSDEGATGGPINALNSQMLANSDFYSGAFAPEYGNALSGVFDMKLRKGNNEKREYSFSVGVLGTDLTAEGPFKKGGGSSFLINYRYSTLSLLTDLGVVDYNGIPKYQDLSFKAHFPTKKAGTFSFFGLGGKSHIFETLYDDENEDEILLQGDYNADMGVVGLSHKMPLSKNSFLETSISVSQNGSGYSGEEFNEQNEPYISYNDKLNKNSIKWASSLHQKINSKHTLQGGLIYAQYFYNFFVEDFDEDMDEYTPDQDSKGNAGHYQGFLSWKYKPVNDLSFVSGLHVHGTTLNQEVSIEPRIGLRWQLRPSQAITAGFGIHGKMESLLNYFAIQTLEDGTEIMPNRDMGFSKARHYVLGYENRLSKCLFLKMEAYYQQLYDIPIENVDNSSYSLINQVEGYTTRSLINEGLGDNYGLELTLERYFENNYYFMFTTSLFNSTYTAMDQVERDTRFNSNYLGNLLFGKEFLLGSSKGKSKVIGLNARISLLGARRYTPIDLEASTEKGETVRREDQAFSDKGDDVFIANLAVSYRVNRKKTSQELKLDIQNVTNNSAQIDEYYNSWTEKIEYAYQLPLLPVVSYTIHF